jgi:hypothetical protein
MSAEAERQCILFNRDSYRETIRLQIFMAENDIPITYTDTISLSELTFLVTTMKDYLKEKGAALNDAAKELNKG